MGMASLDISRHMASSISAHVRSYAFTYSIRPYTAYTAFRTAYVPATYGYVDMWLTYGFVSMICDIYDGMEDRDVYAYVSMICGFVEFVKFVTKKRWFARQPKAYQTSHQ